MIEGQSRRTAPPPRFHPVTTPMRTALSAAPALLLLAAALLPPAHAQPAKGARSGEQVYAQVCSACHATGVANAPKYKDAAAWKPLIAEGQPVLTGHAWVGVRAMPPKGGSPEITLAEFSRGVAHMANAAGGQWPDPDDKLLARIAKEAEERLEQSIREARKMKDELKKLAKPPK